MRQQVAITDDFTFFLLDTKGKRIRVYNPSSTYHSTISGPGNGPSEMQNPFLIYAKEDKVYVIDGLNVRVFNKAGFVKSFRSPMGSVNPVYQGFVWYEWDINKQPGEKNQLLFAADDDIKKSFPLFEWAVPIGENTPTPIQIGEKRNKVKPVLSSDVSLLQVSNDRDVVFFRAIGQSKVNIFNMTDNHRQREINLDPEQIGRLQVDALDNLWVYCKGKNIPKILVFDRDGKRTVSPFTRKSVGRVVAVDQGYAYILTFDQGVEEAGISRCKLEEVEAFIAAHPTSKDW